MNKRISCFVYILLISAGALFLSAAGFPQTKQNEEIMTLNIAPGEWKFTINTPEGFSPEKPDTFSNWGSCEVPALWNESKNIPEKYKSELAGGSGGNISHCWYKKEFDVPENMKGYDSAICFDRIKWGAEVWLNGIKLGEHFGAFSPFEVNAGDVIQYGKKNTLLVKVSGFKNLPKDNNGGYQYSVGNGSSSAQSGGILEPVSIHFYKKLKLSKLKIQPMLDKKGVKVSFNIFTPDDFHGKLVIVFDWCESATGEAIKSFPLPLVNFERRKPRELFFFIPMNDYQLWTPENPHLYKLKLSVVSEDKTISDKTESVFGMREISLKDGKIYFNGSPIKLRGVTLGSEANYALGSSFINNAEKSVYYLSKAVKFMNANFVKADKEMINNQWLDICDRNGIFVIQAFPASVDSNNKENKLLVENRLKEISAILPTQWNHPSVIAYTLPAEESGSANDQELNSKLFIPFIKYQDTSRPVIAQGNASGDFSDFVINKNEKNASPYIYSEKIKTYKKDLPLKPVSCSDFSLFNIEDYIKYYYNDSEKKEGTSGAEFLKANEKLPPDFYKYLSSLTGENISIISGKSFASIVQLNKWANSPKPEKKIEEYFTDFYHIYQSLYSPVSVCINVSADKLKPGEEFKSSIVLSNDLDTTFTFKGEILITPKVDIYAAVPISMQPRFGQSAFINKTVVPKSSEKLECLIQAPEQSGDYDLIALIKNQKLFPVYYKCVISVEGQKPETKTSDAKNADKVIDAPPAKEEPNTPTAAPPVLEKKSK